MSTSNCDLVMIRDLNLGDPVTKEINPFSIDYIRDQIEWMVRPFIHRNMKMQERLQASALTYEIMENLLPSYLDNMAALNQMWKQLDDMVTHRYLITPFGKLHRAAHAVGE